MSDKYTSSIYNLIISAVVIVVMTIGFQLYSVRGTQKGAFFYIKKAKLYMDEGKYDKAMMLLYKAYEKIPSSDVVKENLVLGYVKYSRALVKRGEYDKALENLSMAYEVAPENIYAANDFAIALARKGFYLARDRDYGGAMDKIKTASEVAMASKRARKNLATYLHNKAVEAYNKNDSRTVFICAYMSYLVRPSFDSLIMLGHHFYKESDLEKTRFYWEKALDMKPDDMKLRDSYDRVVKDIALRSKMVAVDIGKFNVSFYRDYNIDQEVLKRVLGDIYNRVGKDLGFYLPDDVPIIFYTEEDFRKALGQKGIVRGYYDGSGIKIVFNSDVNDPDFAAVIAHEYTHAVISYLTDNNAPAWFQEGMAVYEQTPYQSYPKGQVGRFVKKGGKMELAMIDKGFSQMDDESLLVLSYEGAYTAIEFILDKWGWDGIRKILKRMKRRQHYANILDEEFFTSVAMFEKMWNEYVRSEYLVMK